METTEFTRSYLARFYGSKVKVQFFDMANSTDYEQHKALLAKVDGRHMFYPLVFINEELKIVGSAEYYDVLYALREMASPEPRQP